jgi:two-component system, response regulator
MSNVILLVEDNLADEKLTLRVFKLNNLQNEIVVARDGSQALDYLFHDQASQGPRPLPALVLLDLNLPVLGGLEVLRRIRSDERTRYLPIVILTISKAEEDVVSGYALGANAYLRKPVVFAAFTDAVGTLGMYWYLSNEPAFER